MRKPSQLVPLLLIIVLLAGVLLWILPGEFPNIKNEPNVPSEPNRPDGSNEPNQPDKPDEPNTPDKPTEPDEPNEPNEPDEPDEPIDVDPLPSQNYEYSIDISGYLPDITTVYDDILLVNKKHPLGANFSPGLVITLDTDLTYNGKEVQLEITAAAALEAMMLCMRADGITDTYITSGYRDYNYQKTLQEYYINEEMKKNAALSREEALAIVRTYSAAPGSSEHQSGLCVDLITTSMRGLDETFENTEAFEWLQENACRFGFVLRYPKGKEDITGYTYEPWHYRFVGRDVALAITEAGLTLEEYLEK